jgi:hypothetical protein
MFVSRSVWPRDSQRSGECFAHAGDMLEQRSCSGMPFSRNITFMRPGREKTDVAVYSITRP